MNLFGGNAPANIEISFDAEPDRKTGALSRDRRGEQTYIYRSGDDVCGNCRINTKPGSKFDHLGIKVEFVGQIEQLGDKKSTYTFFNTEKSLEGPASLMASKQFTWRFQRADMESETYFGKQVRLRYFVRVVAKRKSGGDLTKELDLLVHNPVVPDPDQLTKTVKMEVGIEEMLRIEFEFDKGLYHMRDVIVGKVYFMCVRIKIKSMELKILRRETAGTGGNQKMENETLTEFEIMDGAPVKDQCIPVRLYLAGLPLTPTYSNVQNAFSVKYLLNLVLVDEEDRKYFKKQEIDVYRQ